MKSALIVLALISCALAANVPLRPIPLMEAHKGHARITGGEEVTPNSIPYQAGLFMGGSFCGGTLINPRWVLTAGHCGVIASTIQVILGAHKIQQSEPTQVILDSEKVIVNTAYNPSTLENDVTLIKLPSDVTLNNNIGVVQLAPANAGDYAGQTATASGWGKTSDSSSGISPVLKKNSFPILSNSVCQEKFGAGIKVFDSVVCIDGANGNSVCNGDSGGPLVVNNVQVGVTSYVTTRGCEAGQPAGFSRVSSFRDWIKTNSGV